MRNLTSFQASATRLRSKSRRRSRRSTLSSLVLEPVRTDASPIRRKKKGGPLPDRPFLPRMLQDTRETVGSLLELDGSAGILDLLLDLLGFVLADAFLDGLRRAFDQRLGFAEAEAGDRADFLDHVDLLATVAGENDVELGLLFGSRSGGGGGGAGRAPATRPG